MTKFQEFYANVRIGDAQAVRNAIESHVSQPTFLNWKRGSFEPDSRWWPTLNEIAVQFGYDKPYTL